MIHDPSFMEFGTGSQYLNSDIFTRLGFYTGTSSEFMLNTAFLMAERETARQIKTFWTPTVVTGSFTSFQMGVPFPVGLGEINGVLDVRFFERNAFGEERQISGSGWVVDGTLGIINVTISPYDNSSLPNSGLTKANCAGVSIGLYQNIPGVYKAEIAVQAGWPSGTWADPTITTAMCMVADQYLKLLRDEGELPDEDLQFIKQYSVGRYSQSVEARWAINNRFGFSGRSQLIQKMLAPWKTSPGLKVGG